jgi:hypothetical protein
VTEALHPEKREDVVLRPEWQVRAEMNDGVIANYVTATIHSRMPPIRLARVTPFDLEPPKAASEANAPPG